MSSLFCTQATLSTNKYPTTSLLDLYTISYIDILLTELTFFLHDLIIYDFSRYIHLRYMYLHREVYSRVTI